MNIGHVSCTVPCPESRAVSECHGPRIKVTGCLQVTRCCRPLNLPVIAGRRGPDCHAVRHKSSSCGPVRKPRQSYHHPSETQRQRHGSPFSTRLPVCRCVGPARGHSKVSCCAGSACALRSGCLVFQRQVECSPTRHLPLSDAEVDYENR